MYELENLIDTGMSESDFEATRSFLSKFVSLLTDGQSRQLGYAIDSKYYQIDDFANERDVNVKDPFEKTRQGIGQHLVHDRMRPRR